jgi:hypothetical protein
MYLHDSQAGLLNAGTTNAVMLAVLVVPILVLGLAFSPFIEFSRSFGF